MWHVYINKITIHGTDQIEFNIPPSFFFKPDRVYEYKIELSNKNRFM